MASGVPLAPAGVPRIIASATVERMRSAGILRPDADPERLALSIFAALQGGLLLTQTMHSLEPLEAALDGALATLRAAAV
jgi:hypothetical protein